MNPPCHIQGISRGSFPCIQTILENSISGDSGPSQPKTSHVQPFGHSLQSLGCQRPFEPNAWSQDILLKESCWAPQISHISRQSSLGGHSYASSHSDSSTDKSTTKPKESKKKRKKKKKKKKKKKADSRGNEGCPGQSALASQTKELDSQKSTQTRHRPKRNRKGRVAGSISQMLKSMSLDPLTAEPKDISAEDYKPNQNTNVKAHPKLGKEGKDSHKPDGAQQKRQKLYKTELCRNWEEIGQCRYDGKCQFAHGINDLHTVERHPKYKTQICRTFHTTGTCPYGIRCTFRHYETSVDEKPNSSLLSDKGPKDSSDSPNQPPDSDFDWGKGALDDRYTMEFTRPCNLDGSDHVGLFDLGFDFDFGLDCVRRMTASDIGYTDGFLPHDPESLLPHELVTDL